jgi:type I restriction enzyme R subunit
MTPEESARKDIDRQLAQSEWQVQNRHGMNLSAGLGIAVREFPTLTGEADYVPLAGGKAVEVVVAKPKGHTAVGVDGQWSKYEGSIPPGMPHCGSPFPFAYESTGTVSQITNLLDSEART